LPRLREFAAPSAGEDGWKNPPWSGFSISGIFSHSRGITYQSLRYDRRKLGLWHAAPIADPVSLYRYAIGRFGLKPTLIEWDNEIPPLKTLLGEAVRAAEIAAEALEVRRALAR
jgi:hypothetical protein